MTAMRAEAPPDTYRLSLEVDVTPLQREELPESETRERGGQEQGAVELGECEPGGQRDVTGIGRFVRHEAAKESNLPSAGLRRPAGFEDRMGHQAPAAPRAKVARRASPPAPARPPRSGRAARRAPARSAARAPASAGRARAGRRGGRRSRRARRGPSPR